MSLKETLKKTDESISKFAVKAYQLNATIVYGKSQNSSVSLEDFNDPSKRDEYIAKINRDQQGLSIFKIYNVVKILNSYDLCNPFTFAVSKAFPPESAIGGKVTEITQLARLLQSKLRNFSIIGGNFLLEGTAASNSGTSIGEGNKIFHIEGGLPLNDVQEVSTATSRIFNSNVQSPPPKDIPVGTRVYIKPNPDENKAGDAEMVGVVESVSAPTPPNVGQSLESYQQQKSATYKRYVIKIERATSPPPYALSPSGGTLYDENEEPIPRKFKKFTFEFEKPQVGDIRELALELQEIQQVFNSIPTFNDLVVELNDIPNDLPSWTGMGKIREKAEKIIEFQKEFTQPILGAAATGSSTVGGVVDTVGGAAQNLAGGLTSEQVLERIGVYKEFYEFIEPFLKFDFSIENIFKKQIEEANKAIRDFIPYEDIAKGVRVIKDGIRFIVGILSFILLLLKFISTVIKVLMVIMKVLKAVIKAIRLVIKFISGAFSTVGATESVTNVLAKMEAAIDKIINFLKKYAGILELIIAGLTLTKSWLKLLVAELVSFAEKLESCPQLSKESELLQAGIATLFPTINEIPPGGEPVNPTDGNGDVIDIDDDGNITFPDPQVSKATDVDMDSSEGQKLRENLNLFTWDKFEKNANGYLMFLRGDIFGFDKFGNVVFYGDLISLATGVNFEESDAQKLRKEIRDRINLYTFDKFRNSPIVRDLLSRVEEIALQKIQRSRVVDPNDVFGNFAEKYQGYTIKIQEEQPIGSTSAQIATRRRGIALDSNERIQFSTELTFSNNLTTIVQEVKFLIDKNIAAGNSNINTPDLEPNEITDGEALELARAIGAPTIGLNNLEAQENTRASNNLVGTSEDTDPNTQVRTGNDPFVSQNEPDINGNLERDATITPDSTTTNKKEVSLGKLTTEPFNEFISQNPSLKKISDTLGVLSRLGPSQLSQILSEPGMEDLNEDELASKLKQSILSEIDPNPDKVKEVQRKTEQWYEGLKSKARSNWERRRLKKSFDKYFESVVKESLPQWVRLLLRQRYTENEINYGIQDDEIRDRFRIKIDGTKVKVRRRPAFKKEDD